MSFTRYPSYKDSGVEWLGEVPGHWVVAKTVRYFKVAMGQTILREDLIDDGEWPVFSATDGDHYFGRVNEPQVRLAVGDIVIPARGNSIGAVKLVKEPSTTTQTTIYCKNITSGKLDPSFVFHFLKGCKDNLFYFTQTAIPQITVDEVGSNPILIPPLPEQTQIAAFLDRETAKIDELVAEQRRLMELLKEKRQAVISHAVTQGLNPDATMKPSGIEWLGDVPQAWAVKKLGRAVFMQEGPGLRTWQFTDEGTRVICVTNITESGIDFSRLEKFISTEEYNSIYRHFTVRPGDVLLSSSGNSWGKVAIYDGEEEVILNTSTIRLNQLEDAPLNRDYIAMLLQSDTVREQLGLAMTGSCQPNFGPTHLNCVMVAIPSKAEQSAIVTHLSTYTAKLDTLTAEAQRAIGLLQERRSALISAAVTGQIDVRGVCV